MCEEGNFAACNALRISLRLFTFLLTTNDLVWHSTCAVYQPNHFTSCRWLTGSSCSRPNGSGVCSGGLIVLVIQQTTLFLLKKNNFLENRFPCYQIKTQVINGYLQTFYSVHIAPLCLKDPTFPRIKFLRIQCIRFTCSTKELLHIA